MREANRGAGERVPAGAAGMRLDVWLRERHPAWSRAALQRLIREGQVAVNGSTVRAGARLRAGDRVTMVVPPPRPATPLAEALPLAICFEDGDLLVVNKAAGQVVHPAAGHPDGTLVNALLHHCDDLAGIGGEERPGIVHRLDKDTSGLIVVAKHDAALRALAAQFKARTVEKAYAAVVAGCPDPPTGRIETLLGRSARDRQKMSARPARGRVAVTRYQVTETLPGAALVTVAIETGRTHQIRVHMAHIGHPLVGDARYGFRAARYPALPAAGRQLLHACRLGFDHPRSGMRIVIEAPLPADLREWLDAARRKG